MRDLRRWLDDILRLTVLLGVGFLLAWLDRSRPTLLGAWGPYEFSWPITLALAVPIVCYRRGCRLGEAPSRVRRFLFYVGVALAWIVLQTRLAYLAQHLFIATRLQHLAIHHLAPFLVALAWPYPTIGAGLPLSPGLRAAATRRARPLLRPFRRPVIASVLFVGLIYLWLTPPVQFRAMLDPTLYAVMNWSMLIDGLLFWTVLFDPRPDAPPIPVRIVIAVAVQMPQILLGGFIALTDRELYPSYSLCGRVFASISPMLDQQIGGFIVWYPAAMMSAVAVFILLRRLSADRSPVLQPGTALPIRFPEHDLQADRFRSA